MKQKSTFGITSQRYMIHGIQLNPREVYNQDFAEQLKRLQRDFGKSRGDIMFQIGIVTAFETDDTYMYKDQTKIQANKAKRLAIQSNMQTRYNLQPTLREHMPEATVVINLQQDERIKGYSESGRRYLNKGKKADLSFQEATLEEWNMFYKIRYTTAFDKGFGVIPLMEFERLRDFLITEKKGQLFLAKQGSHIISGSICLFDNEMMIYLYGATDRIFGDIGGHYRLTDQIIQWGKEHHYQYLDLLGIAPLGYPVHHLVGVSRFKQCFGGKTISSLGNFDLVYNKLLYKGFQRMKS